MFSWHWRDVLYFLFQENFQTDLTRLKILFRTFILFKESWTKMELKEDPKERTAQIEAFMFGPKITSQETMKDYNIFSKYYDQVIHISKTRRVQFCPLYGGVCWVGLDEVGWGWGECHISWYRVWSAGIFDWPRISTLKPQHSGFSREDTGEDDLRLPPLQEWVYFIKWVISVITRSRNISLDLLDLTKNTYHEKLECVRKSCFCYLY